MKPIYKIIDHQTYFIQCYQAIRNLSVNHTCDAVIDVVYTIRANLFQWIDR